MKRQIIPSLLFPFLVASPLAAGPLDLSKIPPAADRKVDYIKDIQPIFEENCYKCHGKEKQESAFRLDEKSEALKGGDHGPDIVPGKGQESLLIHALTGAREDVKPMPRKAEPLSKDKIGLIRAWIDQGLK